MSRLLPRKPLPVGNHQDRKWLAYVAELLRCLCGKCSAGPTDSWHTVSDAWEEPVSSGERLTRTRRDGWLKGTADALTGVLTDLNGWYQTSVAARDAMDAVLHETHMPLASIVTVLRDSLRQVEQGRAYLLSGHVEAARKAVPILGRHGKLTFAERVSELSQADTQTSGKPDGRRRRPGRKPRQPDKLDRILRRDIKRGLPELEDHKWATYLDSHRDELPNTTADKIRMRYNRLKGSPEANG